MKILVLANFGLGLYKFRKELLEKLVSNHDEVFVSFPFDEYYVPKIKELGCTYIETDYDRKGTNPVADLKLMNEYRKILKEKRPDVVLTYTIKPTVYGGMACQLEKIPYIVNITGLSAATENGGLIGKIVVMLYRIGLRKASKVFFQNETNRDFMVDNGIVRCENEIIPGSGVNLKQYEVFDYPDEPCQFAFIGRITETKGIGFYLEAAKKLKEKYPETVFHVCGGFDEDDYKEKISEFDKDGIIRYHGIVDDMKQIYKNIHCTVLPTFYAEGMSNVLLESLACGRPIITTDRPGCKEIVDDGANGFIVKQKDADDLAEKMEKFICLDHESKRQMGISGRNKVERQFDRNIVIEKYCKEIDRYRK